MAKKIEWVFRIFFVMVFVVSGYQVLRWYFEMAIPTLDQQLAEQNRQARVASELMAAEVGDFAVMKNDDVLIIALVTSDGDISLCRPVDCNPSQGRITHEHAKRIVQHVVKLYGNDVELLQTVRRYSEWLRPHILQ